MSSGARYGSHLSDIEGGIKGSLLKYAGSISDCVLPSKDLVDFVIQEHRNLEKKVIFLSL
jgi:hypothetical protein